MKHRIRVRTHTRKVGRKKVIVRRHTKHIRVRRNFGMALPLSLTEENRRILIEESIKKMNQLPEEKKTEREVERLTEITKGFGKEEVENIMDTFKDQFIPIEQHAKKYGLAATKSGPATESDIRAHEFSESIWKMMGGRGEEESLANRLGEIRDYSEKMEKALLGFAPDESNRAVWKAMLKDPEKIQVWGGESHPEYPKKIIKVEKTNDYTDRGYPTQIWRIEDEEGNSGYIDYNIRTKKAEFNSP